MRHLHDNGRNTIKGGSRETKGQKGTGGGRTGYGKREIVTPLSPPHYNCLEFSQPLSCLYQAMQTRKTFSIA